MNNYEIKIITNNNIFEYFWETHELPKFKISTKISVPGVIEKGILGNAWQYPLQIKDAISLSVKHFLDKLDDEEDVDWIGTLSISKDRLFSIFKEEFKSRNELEFFEVINKAEFQRMEEWEEI